MSSSKKVLHSLTSAFFRDKYPQASSPYNFSDKGKHSRGVFASPQTKLDENKKNPLMFQFYDPKNTKWTCHSADNIKKKLPPKKKHHRSILTPDILFNLRMRKKMTSTSPNYETSIKNSERTYDEDLYTRANNFLDAMGLYVVSPGDPSFREDPQFFSTSTERGRNLDEAIRGRPNLSLSIDRDLSKSSLFRRRASLNQKSAFAKSLSLNTNDHACNLLFPENIENYCPIEEIKSPSSITPNLHRDSSTQSPSFPNLRPHYLRSGSDIKSLREEPNESKKGELGSCHIGGCLKSAKKHYRDDLMFATQNHLNKASSYNSKDTVMKECIMSPS